MKIALLPCMIPRMIWLFFLFIPLSFSSDLSEKQAQMEQYIGSFIQFLPKFAAELANQPTKKELVEEMKLIQEQLTSSLKAKRLYVMIQVDLNRYAGRDHVRGAASRFTRSISLDEKLIFKNDIGVWSLENAEYWKTMEVVYHEATHLAITGGDEVATANKTTYFLTAILEGLTRNSTELFRYIVPKDEEKNVHIDRIMKALKNTRADSKFYATWSEFQSELDELLELRISAVDQYEKVKKELEDKISDAEVGRITIENSVNTLLSPPVVELTLQIDGNPNYWPLRPDFDPTASTDVTLNYQDGVHSDWEKVVRSLEKYSFEVNNDFSEIFSSSYKEERDRQLKVLRQTTFKPGFTAFDLYSREEMKRAERYILAPLSLTSPQEDYEMLVQQIQKYADLTLPKDTKESLTVGWLIQLHQILYAFHRFQWTFVDHPSPGDPSLEKMPKVKVSVTPDWNDSITVQKNAEESEIKITFDENDFDQLREKARWASGLVWNSPAFVQEMGALFFYTDWNEKGMATDMVIYQRKQLKKIKRVGTTGNGSLEWDREEIKREPTQIVLKRRIFRELMNITGLNKSD